MRFPLGICFALPLFASAQSVVIYESNVVVQTFAGSGFYGHVDGVGAETMFGDAFGLRVNRDTNFFVTETIAANSSIGESTGTVRRCSSSAVVTTVTTFVNNMWGASVSAVAINGLTGDVWYRVTIGSPSLYYTTSNGAKVGPISEPPYYYSPRSGMAFDSSGALYFATSHRIYRRSSGGAWDVFVGSGNRGYVNGNGVFTAFADPTAIAFDTNDNLYVFDWGNSVIRKVTPLRDVSTYAGAPAGPESDSITSKTNTVLSQIRDLAIDFNGDILVSQPNRIRRITQTSITTLAGSTVAGYSNGRGHEAAFNNLNGICVAPDGHIYVVDIGNRRIRRLSFLRPEHEIPPSRLQLGFYAGLQIDGVANRTYRIEHTANNLDWSESATVTIPTSPYLWFDIHSTNTERRFYRAILLP